MEAITAAVEKIKKDSELRGKLGMMTSKFLDMAALNVGTDHKSLVLSFKSDGDGNMAHAQMSKGEHKTLLQELIGELTGRSVDINCIIKESLAETDISSLNLSKVNFDIITQE